MLLLPTFRRLENTSHASLCLGCRLFQQRDAESCERGERLGQEERRKTFGRCISLSPSFQLNGLKQLLELEARKTQSNYTSRAEFVVIAKDVAGVGGIRGAWKQGGVGNGNQSAVVVGPPRRCLPFPSLCSTIYLEFNEGGAVLSSCRSSDMTSELTSHDAKFGASLHVRIVSNATGIEDDSLAMMMLEAQVVKPMCEGVFPFRVHVPVTADRSEWTYSSMNGSLSVIAVSDAFRSEMWVCQGSSCLGASVGGYLNSTNGAGPVNISIKAKDIDGFEINRDGERLIVDLLRGTAIFVAEFVATWSGDKSLYTARLDGLTAVGAYTLRLRTALNEQLKARFELRCASGFETTAGVYPECRPQRSVCDSVDRHKQTVVINDTTQLLLRPLKGSVSSIELVQVPNNPTRFIPIPGLRTEVKFDRVGKFQLHVVQRDEPICILPYELTAECPADRLADLEGRCVCRPTFVDDGGGRCVCPKGYTERTSGPDRQQKCECPESFMDDGGGNCVCPVGHHVDNTKNPSRCAQPQPCSDASLRFSDNTIYTTSESTNTHRAGTTIMVTSRAAVEYKTVLTPKQGEVVSNISEQVWLNRTGEFSLKLSVAGQQCTLIETLHVAETCDDLTQWADTVAGGSRCLQRPKMAVQAPSDVLKVVHTKTRAKPNGTERIEVRLVRGDVDAGSMVTWNASSSSEWLVLLQASGSVSTVNPVASMIVSVNGSGQNETTVSEPLRANITVHSRLRGRSDLFAEETSTVTMMVEVTINALVVLLAEDIRVKDVGSGNDLQADGRVAAGDKLTVTVETFDYERMAIRRAGLLITATLSAEAKASASMVLQYDPYLAAYRGEVPSSWLVESPTKYTLCIHSSGDCDGDAIKLDFEVTKANQTLIVAGVIGAVRAPMLDQAASSRMNHARTACCKLQLLVALFVLALFLAYKHHSRAKEFLLKFLQSEGVPVLEVRLTQISTVVWQRSKCVLSLETGLRSSVWRCGT